VTAFGVLPTSTSPAARRLYEAGQRRARRIAAEKAQIAREQEQLREALEIRKAREAKAARDAWAKKAIEEAEARADIVAPPTKTMREILDEVLAKHNVSAIDFFSERRNHPFVLARQEFMWRARKETFHSMPTIGRFCRRDHTTVMHGSRAHEKRMKEGA
jgi:chromosomal replication initiation ATPase DnaA